MLPTSSTSPINRPVPDFALSDHLKNPFTLKCVMGSGGLLLGFIGDIWRPVSVHRILGLQRHAKKLTQMGCTVALVIRDNVSTLHNFHISSPLPVPFPLLADAEGKVHSDFSIERPCLLLVTRDGVLRHQWHLHADTVLPDGEEIFGAVQRETAKH